MGPEDGVETLTGKGRFLASLRFLADIDVSEKYV